MVRNSSYIPMAGWILLRTSSPCMRCLVTFGSISRQRLASFSIALLSMTMIQRRTEIWIWQGAHQFHLWPKRYDKGAHQFHLWSKRYVISSCWLQLCQRCSGLCNPWGTSGFEFSSETIAPIKVHCTRSLSLFQASVLLPWSPPGCHWRCLSLVFSGHWSLQHLFPFLYLEQVLSRLSTKASSSCSSSARASM